MTLLKKQLINISDAIIQPKASYVSLLLAIAMQMPSDNAKAALFDSNDIGIESSLFKTSPDKESSKADDLNSAIKNLIEYENTNNKEAIQLIKQGVEKLTTQERQQGLNELKKAWNLDKRLIPAGIAIGINHLQNREFEQALEIAKEIQKITTKEDFGLGYTLEGMAHAGKGELEQAEKAFKTAIKVMPTEKNALFNLASLAENKKNYKEAKTYLQKILDIESLNLNALEKLGRIESILGNTQNATSLLLKAVENHPNDNSPIIALAQVYLRAHDYQKVILLTDNKTDPGILEMRGKAYLNLGETEKAKETFESIIQQLPQAASANYLLAEFYAITGKVSEATQQIESAVSKDPKFLPARIGQVKTLFLSGKGDDANKSVQRLISEFGDKPEIISIAGWLATKQGDFKSAEKHFEQLAKNKADTEIILWWVNSLWAQNKRDDGFKVLKNWLNQNPKDLSAQLALADGYMGFQKKSEAKEAYLKLIEQNPKLTAAYNNLAWLTQETDLKQAINYAESALKLEGDNPQVLDTLGLLLIKDGKLDRGEALLKQATEKAANSDEILYHYAEVLVMRKKYVEANPILARLNQLNLTDSMRERVKTLTAEASKK